MGTNICSLPIHSHSAQIVIFMFMRKWYDLCVWPQNAALRTHFLSDSNIIHLFSLRPQNFRLISFPHLISFGKYCFFPGKWCLFSFGGAIYLCSIIFILLLSHIPTYHRHICPSVCSFWLLLVVFVVCTCHMIAIWLGCVCPIRSHISRGAFCTCRWSHSTENSIS